MEPFEKRDITTGNGSTPIPILASESAHTEERLQPSPVPTSIESGSTKPLTLKEALSLLQTNCLDLRNLNCEVGILARGKRLYIIVQVPPDTGELAMQDGHITISGEPVSKG